MHEGSITIRIPADLREIQRLNRLVRNLLDMTRLEGGALKDTKRLTGLFSIVIRPPKTVEAVRKNPLGIYVHAFNWSQDVATKTAGDAK